MENYKNLSGDSGVVAFELGFNFIKIRFTGFKTYTYNYVKPGKLHVDNMTTLAVQGRGLCSYISRRVKHNYYSKGL